MDFRTYPIVNQCIVKQEAVDDRDGLVVAAMGDECLRGVRSDFRVQGPACPHGIVCIRSYALIMSITFMELFLGLSLFGVEYVPKGSMRCDFSRMNSYAIFVIV